MSGTISMMEQSTKEEYANICLKFDKGLLYVI